MKISGILKSIDGKRVLYRNCNNKRSDDSKLKYTKYKNKLTSVNRIAESKFYYDKCELAKGNINKPDKPSIQLLRGLVIKMTNILKK